MDKRSVQVPDIGDFQEVEVIDILVQSGDRIQEEDPLITLESDKASMDVPSPFSGTISSIQLKVGDKVSEGNLILELEEELINSEPTTQKSLEEKTPPSEENNNPSKTTATQSSRQVSKADLNCEVLVLGAGPGGYTAAFRAADLGKKVILVERYESLGGVCLNVGCIPSKALLHAAKVIDDAHAMKDHGIDFGNPKIDPIRLSAWKNSVVGKLTNGLKSLAKQRKVECLAG